MNRTNTNRRNQMRAKKRRRRKRIVRLQLLTLNLVGIILIIFISLTIYNRFHTKEEQAGKDEPTKELQQNSSKENQTQNVLKEEQTQDVSKKKQTKDKKAKKIWEKNKELLVLVNKENICPEEGISMRKICNGRLEAADILYSDLCQMLEDARMEGHQFFIASAYRSAKRQQQLVDEDVRLAMNQGLNYEDALAKTYEETMPSGYSEHQTGLALDILASSNQNMDVTQEQAAENQWLQEHCSEYGFILRYPKDKEDVTLISYEPWHFRYVGKEAAKYMKKNKLTLEEFYLKL